MQTDFLVGVWTGSIHSTNGWDMKMTLSILQPIEIGSMLGVFNIPMIPCSGSFRVIAIRGDTLDLQAEKLQGNCQEAESDSLEMLPDGTLLYVSKGGDWEIQGTLQKAFDESAE